MINLFLFRCKYILYYIVTFNQYYYFKIISPLRLAWNKYFQIKFTEGTNNSRDTWKTLSSLILCKNTSKDVTLNNIGSWVSDPSAIAEVFTNYFSNVASNIDRDIPHSNISPLNFLGALVENSFFCQSFDSQEIVNLNHREKNKSIDLMNIPSLIFKILSLRISPTVLITTRCLKVSFLNALKQLKLSQFLNLVAQILLWIADLFPCCLSYQKYFKNWCVLE